MNNSGLEKLYIMSYIIINIPATPLPLARATMAGFFFYRGGDAV
jgi:hypothetical protein